MKIGDKCKFEELDIGDIFYRGYSPRWVKIAADGCRVTSEPGTIYSMRVNNNIQYTYGGVHFPTLIKHNAKK
jgi:hypothetical protein